MRASLLPVLTVLLMATALAGCGRSTGDASASSAAADPGATAATAAPEDSSARARTLQVAERLVAQTDSALGAVDPLSASEKRRLRTYLQPEHMQRAQQIGFEPVRRRRDAADLEARSDGRAVRLTTNDYYIVDPAMSYAVPVVVPSTQHMLTRIGQRFQANLTARGLPTYRFVLTNLLRTDQDQAALSGSNVNAAQQQSTHEYGTTVDIFYQWFHYAAVHDTLAPGVLPPAPDSSSTSGARADLDETLLRRRLYRAYVGFGREHARAIKAVLGRAILELQDEGVLLATYERQQPVFHLTVAQQLAPPDSAAGRAARSGPVHRYEDLATARVRGLLSFGSS